MSKGKKSIVAVIRGENNKKKQGTVENFRHQNGRVVVDFLDGSDKEPEEVNYNKLEFPNYKAQNAAEALKSSVIAQFVPAD